MIQWVDGGRYVVANSTLSFTIMTSTHYTSCVLSIEEYFDDGATAEQHCSNQLCLPEGITIRLQTNLTSQTWKEKFGNTFYDAMSIMHYKPTYNAL